MSTSLNRRRLLALVGGAVAGVATQPWPLRLPRISAQVPIIDDLLVVPTLEAFADTLIPGERRHPGDRPIAGVVEGPGAVHAGAVDLLYFPPAGVAPLLPALAVLLNTRATAYAVQHGILLDLGVAPFVALDFDQRTDLAIGLFDGDPDELLWTALSALVFLAFHTAGHLHAAHAVRAGHPGLEYLEFPEPDPDDLWRFSEQSYQQQLAEPHPATTPGGHPA